jgi:diguanylate cyclase (GGDEF)-like protein
METAHGTLSRHAAAAAALVAAVSLAGWLGDVDALAHPRTVTPMSPLGGVVVLVLAAGVWALAAGRRRVSAAAGLVAVIAGLTGFADALIGRGTWVNSTLFGVPATLTALAGLLLALLGTAIALNGRAVPLTRTLGLTAAALAVAALIGYALGAPAFYDRDPRLDVPWPTALAVILLAIGFGAALPGSHVGHFLDDPGMAGRFARRTFPVVLGIPVLTGIVATAAARAGWLPYSDATWAMTLAAVLGLAGVAGAAARRLREHEGALTELATRDALTGGYNRRQFVVEAERAAARAERYGERAAVVIVDVDHFKQINDAFGHAAGDDVLVRVYRSLRARLRSSDVLGRLGGDEFGAVVLHADRNAAEAVAAQMRAAVAALRDDLAAEGRPSRLAASIGVAELGADVAAALELADRRMYADKRGDDDLPEQVEGSAHH